MEGSELCNPQGMRKQNKLETWMDQKCVCVSFPTVPTPVETVTKIWIFVQWSETAMVHLFEDRTNLINSLNTSSAANRIGLINFITCCSSNKLAIYLFIYFVCLIKSSIIQKKR